MYRSFIIFIISILLLHSCNNSKPKVIPDDNFRKILIDLSIADAYVSSKVYTGDKKAITIFEPILDKYGYSLEDLTFTIESHAKRKSNVLTSIIKSAIEDIDKIRKVTEYNNDLNKDWIEKAKEHFKTNILTYDSTIHLKSIEDIDTVKFAVDLESAGEYTVRYRYTLDSTDRNKTRYFRYTLLDSTTNEIAKTETSWLYNKKEPFMFEKTIAIPKINEKINRMEIDLIYYGRNRTNIAKPNISFDSLSINHIYFNEEASQKYMLYHMKIEEFYNLIQSYYEENSSSLPSDWWQINQESIDNTRLERQDSVSRE